MINWKALEKFGNYGKKSLMAGIVYGQGLKGRARAAQNPAPAGFPQELWDAANQRAAAMIAAMQAPEASGAEPETPEEEPFDKEAFCVGIAAGRSLEGWEIDGATNLPSGWGMVRFHIHVDKPDTIKLRFFTSTNFTGMEYYSALDLDPPGFIDFGDGNIQTLSKRELDRTFYISKEHNYEIGDYIFTLFAYRLLGIENYSDSQTREYTDNPVEWRREHKFDETDGQTYSMRYIGFLGESAHKGTLRAVYLDGGVDVADDYCFRFCSHLEYFYFPSWNNLLAAINVNKVSHYVTYNIKKFEKCKMSFGFSLYTTGQMEDNAMFNLVRKFYRETLREHTNQREIHYNISFSLWVQNDLFLWDTASDIDRARSFDCKFSATLFFSDKTLNFYDLNGLLVLPDGIERIGGDIFSFTSITSAIIPNTVTTIGTSAFSYTNLYSITIPNGVKQIQTAAFFECYYMREASIPESVISIGQSAFYGTQLTSVTINRNATVGDHAFPDNCTINYY